MNELILQLEDTWMYCVSLLYHITKQTEERTPGTDQPSSWGKRPSGNGGFIHPVELFLQCISYTCRLYSCDMQIVTGHRYRETAGNRLWLIFVFIIRRLSTSRLLWECLRGENNYSACFHRECMTQRMREKKFSSCQVFWGCSWSRTSSSYCSASYCILQLLCTYYIILVFIFSDFVTLFSFLKPQSYLIWYSQYFFCHLNVTLDLCQSVSAWTWIQIWMWLSGCPTDLASSISRLLTLLSQFWSLHAFWYIKFVCLYFHWTLWITIVVMDCPHFGLSSLVSTHSTAFLFRYMTIWSPFPVLVAPATLTLTPTVGAIYSLWNMQTVVRIVACSPYVCMDFHWVNLFPCHKRSR